jgi:hypothetical protein
MEMLIEDATVITMAPAGAAEAILIRDGRIAAVGSSGEVRAAAGPGVARTRHGVGVQESHLAGHRQRTTTCDPHRSFDARGL